MADQFLSELPDTLTVEQLDEIRKYMTRLVQDDDYNNPVFVEIRTVRTYTDADWTNLETTIAEADALGLPWHHKQLAHNINICFVYGNIEEE